MAQNGTNGTANSLTNGSANKAIPATNLIADFVATAKPTLLTEALREKLKEVIIDYIGVVVGAIDNAESTDKIYKAILALQGSHNGNCTVLTKGSTYAPQYAALLNAAFGHSMDFDDTFADGTLHAGITAISAALTQAEALGSATTSDEFLLAVAVGYEVNCRLGRELGFEAYSQGMHNTSTAGIFGAVAAIAVLKHLNSHTIEMAFGLAGSKAAGSMQYLDNGSWNKRLHPGFAVHDAFMCVTLAEAGVIGATRIFEGKQGFLQAYSPKTDKDLRRLTADLGKEWIWLGSALKPYPACRMTHGVIEMAGDLGGSRKNVSTKDVKVITLTMSPSNFILVGDPNPNKIHPANVIDAQFSAYFQTANALLYGSATGLKAYHKLADPEIQALCDKITFVKDSSMKGMASTIRVEWADGKIEERTLDYPLGEPSHPFTMDRVYEKYFSLTSPAYGEKKATEIRDVVENIEHHTVAELLELAR